MALLHVIGLAVGSAPELVFCTPYSASLYAALGVESGYSP
jgi:hypothetical protein